MKVSEDKYVSLSYELHVGEGQERELMESVTADQPLKFIFGMGMMLDAFESQLNGLQAGDQFSFTLSPEEAYGEYDDDHLIDIPKKVFEVDGQFDSARVVEGTVLPMRDSYGRQMTGSVAEVKDQVVVMDFNHPLAGETLHFTGAIIDVHEATEEEFASLTGGCSSCNSSSCGSGCSGS